MVFVQWRFAEKQYAIVLPKIIAVLHHFCSNNMATAQTFLFWTRARSFLYPLPFLKLSSPIILFKPA
jgi:hypothetical protein